MNINNALTGTAATDTDRAVDAWKRISEKPSSITMRRDDGTAVAAQTVRIEWDDNSNSEPSGAGGKSSMRRGTVFGVVNHATVADTDIQRGDRFTVSGYQYRVVDVLTTLGEKQGRFEAMG